MSTVVVIGAGLAGLSAACHLVSQGHRVLVIEKESGPGGRALRIRQDGFTFDLGPTVMTMPELLDEPLRAIGSSQQKAVPMRRLDPAYRGVFADHSELLIRNSTEATAQHIHHLCGPHDAQALRELEPFLAELYTTALPHFIDTNFDSPLDLLRSPQAALKLLKMGAFAPMAKMINTRISDERLRRMLTFQALYAGLSPTTALGVYALITYMDTFRGVYLPEGGMGAIPHGMAQALAPHATIHYDTTVHSLMRGRGGRTVGVNTNDGPIPADAVICTIDTPTAYRYLLPDLPLPRPLRNPTYSPSAVVWHVGARGPLPPNAAHHNIHFGHAWENCFTELINHQTLMSDPARLVTISSLGEPHLAPPDTHTLYILEPVPNLNGNIDWNTETTHIRERLHAFLDENKYPTDIITERLITPLDWKNLGMAAGTPFALAHHFRQTGPFRPANHEPRIPGLFFAGSATIPGVGVPMVLISGKLAAQRTRNYLRKKHL